MELGHYLNELRLAQSSIREMSQSVSRESLGNDEEILLEKEELRVELGPFKYSRLKERHRSSTNSIQRKDLEETQSEAVGSQHVLSQNEEKRGSFDLSSNSSKEMNERFSLWKGVNRQA